MFDSTVSWSASAARIDGSLWRITVTGRINPEYHIYDVVDHDGATNPTVVTVTGENVALSGDLQVLCDVSYGDDPRIGTISGEAVFAQDVILSADSAEAQIYVEWMACTDTSCTPPDDAVMTVRLGTPAGSKSRLSGSTVSDGQETMLSGENGGTAPIGIAVAVSCAVAALAAAAVYFLRKRKKNS